MIITDCQSSSLPASCVDRVHSKVPLFFLTDGLSTAIKLTLEKGTLEKVQLEVLLEVLPGMCVGSENEKLQALAKQLKKNHSLDENVQDLEKNSLSTRIYKHSKSNKNKIKFE